jgi:hypothetical protein
LVSLAAMPADQIHARDRAHAYDHFAHNRFGKSDDQFTPRRNATEESQVASPLRAGGVTTAV